MTTNTTVVNQRLNKTEFELTSEVQIKNEDSTDENDTRPETFEEEKHCPADTHSDMVNQAEPLSDQNDKAIQNLVILGTRIPSNGNDTEHTEVKSKGKRKNKTELELLGLKGEDNVSDGDFDGVGDENKVFKKYKLRKTEQISYKEPPDIKPERSVSTDNEGDMTCPNCQKEFENRGALRNHMRIHIRSVREYTCSLCSKKFDKNADLIAHRETHKTESFLCTECKLAFSDYCDYLLHNHVHLSPAPFKCSECGLRYKKSSYKIHIVTHFDRKLSCDLCPFVTNGEYNLRSHMNEQHSVTITCVECGEVLKSKKNYDYHMTFHTGVKTFQCLYCGACFRHDGARKVHTRIHTGEKPFTCEICGHKARQLTDIKRHKEIHVKEKKYVCDLCGKKYLHKDYLVIHMRSHTKSSLYECPECDATFVSAAGLKVHAMFKHTTERPVECELCNKRFINYNQYRKHCRAKYHLRNVYGLTKNKEKEE